MLSWRAALQVDIVRVLKDCSLNVVSAKVETVVSNPCTTPSCTFSPPAGPAQRHRTVVPRPSLRRSRLVVAPFSEA